MGRARRRQESGRHKAARKRLCWLGCGEGEWARGKSRLTGAGVGLVHGLEGLGGMEERSGMDLRDVSAGKESDGDVGGGNGIREFGDGEDVEGIHSEENGVELAAKGIDGSTDGFKAVLVIDNATPSGAGEADLVAKTRHGDSFWGKGIRTGVRPVWG